MKRVTAKKSRNREIEASHHPVPFECFDRVGRATWVIATTRGKQRGYSNLVTANEQNKERAHRSAYDSSYPATNLSNISIQLIKRRTVGLGFRPYEKIDATEVR